MLYADCHVSVKLKGSKKTHFETYSVWWHLTLNIIFSFRHNFKMKISTICRGRGKHKTRSCWKPDLAVENRTTKRRMSKNKVATFQYSKKSLSRMWLWTFPHAYWACKERLWGTGFNLQQGYFACTLETGLLAIHTVENLYDSIK